MITFILHLWCCFALAAGPGNVAVETPNNNGGLNLALSWDHVGDARGYYVLRSLAADGPYDVVVDLPRGTTSFVDTVTTKPAAEPPASSYWYRVVAQPATPSASLQAALQRAQPAEGKVPGPVHAELLLQHLGASEAIEGRPQAVWLTGNVGRVHLMTLIVAMGGLMVLFTRQVQQGAEIFIRRIPGIDAIEEGVGRATEMGRPVLYVPGIDELQDIQTIASMLILGQVSKTIATYQADIVVACRIPIVREVADEVVKAGFYLAGHPDAYRPSEVRFISSDQFAFTAGTNGIILREKPATNLYLGRFFAESLILAETGYVNRSIQVAGTAETSQLPFFIAACDYTLIGEELFAVSAYLSRDPRLVSSLKASDYLKLYLIGFLIVGAVSASFGLDWAIVAFTMGEG